MIICVIAKLVHFSNISQLRLVGNMHCGWQVGILSEYQFDNQPPKSKINARSLRFHEINMEYIIFGAFYTAIRISCPEQDVS